MLRLINSQHKSTPQETYPTASTVTNEINSKVTNLSENLVNKIDENFETQLKILDDAAAQWETSLTATSVDLNQKINRCYKRLKDRYIDKLQRRIITLRKWNIALIIISILSLIISITNIFI